MKPILRLALAATACLLTLAEAGLASAQPAGVNAGIGTPNDAAWSGSGSGTLVAIDKYIAAKVEATRALLAGTLTVSVSGTPAVTCAACATSANQSTANTSLSSIVTNTTGLATAANQSTANSSLSSIVTNTTGAATAANQSTANSSLSSIDTKVSSTNTKLDTLHSDLTAATPAGSNIIGKTGIDQTTPGVTNGVTMAPSSSSAVGIAPAASTTAEACHVFKASAGNLYSVTGYVGGAAWIMVFNATSAPSDGAVTPVAWAYSPAAGSWSISYGDLPAYMSTGITVCASSTGPFSKTAFSTNTGFAGRVQ